MFYVYENNSPFSGPKERWMTDDVRFIQWHEKKIAGPIAFDEALVLIKEG